jgi:hypothetical protein
MRRVDGRQLFQLLIAGTFILTVRQVSAESLHTASKKPVIYESYGKNDGFL